MNSAQFIDQKSCYLCGCKLRAVEREMGTSEGQLYLRWVRCRDCQLVYLDPRPSLHALSVLYDSQGYWQGESGYQDYLKEGSWRRRQAKDRAEWFVKNLKKNAPKGPLSVLEVGSAAGYFLQELASREVCAQGLDLSRPMVRLSEMEGAVGVSVIHGLVEESEFPAEHFQGLAAWGCDSNFNDPLAAFKKFNRWLKPEGLLAFNFHDYDHWANSLKGRFKIMPNALYFLNSKLVRSLLSEAGFKIVSMKTELNWMNLLSLHHHTGHPWIMPSLKTPLAGVPFKLPVPGGFRVLAQKI